jgi:hypothetical protein
MAEQPASNRMAGRVLMTGMGVAFLIWGASMPWVRTIDGFSLSVRALYQRPFESETGLPTVGLLMVLLAVLGVFGLVTTGWLTRLAGSLAVVAFILLTIQSFVAGGIFVVPRPGPLVALAGGILMVIGGE